MKFFTAMVLCLFSFVSQAAENNTGGISLGATRVIFVSDKSSAGLTVNNSSKKDTWLIRAWMAPYKTGKNAADTRKVPFIITPPLYRINPDEQLQLRINGTDIASLPADRESVFTVNVLAIPPKTQLKQDGQKKAANELSGGTLQFAINNQIKLFYRPAALNETATLEKARGQLKVTRKAGSIDVSNPGPYYFTLVNVRVNGADLRDESGRDLMVAPFSSLSISVPDAKSLEYQTINDFGANTAVVKTVF